MSKPDENEIKGPVYKRKQIEAGVRQMLQGLGVDLNDENFAETPARVAKAYIEMCSGLYTSEKKAEEIFGKKFRSSYKGMIVVGPISAAGVCPHHLLPVHMTAVLAYISDAKDGYKLGLSKLARAFRLYANRPMMQESISHDLVEAFEKYTKCSGVGLWINGRHSCMSARGVLAHESAAITQDVRGLFETDPGVKTEFAEQIRHLTERVRR
jgi:GTP cyclohydrolase I